MTNQRTDKVYIRLDDKEVFIKDRKNGMFYNKGMQSFKDKGHLVSEFTEELLDSLVEKGLFKLDLSTRLSDNLKCYEQ